MAKHMDDKELLERARAARASAYCPYSDFRVGAAILDENGEIHAGCNVENAAYPLGSCAEAGAIAALVAAGGRRIVAIAIVGGTGAEPGTCAPCGGCRQRIQEFADAGTRVIFRDDDGEWRSYTISELLPASFHL